MTSWATITLDMMDEQDVKTEKNIPTGLLIDKGIDEQGWVVEDEVYFALSNGRYQHLRFIEHAKNFHSPWFNGVRRASVADVENTGDTATIYILRPLQDQHDERIDGFEIYDEHSGSRWPAEKRQHLRQRVEDEHGFKPQIEPIDSTTPPDMVLRMPKDTTTNK